MKNIKVFILCCLSMGAIVAFSSCEDDPCETVVCQNDGVCSDGVCDCPDGYSGTLCETEQRTVFLGTYNAAEECSSAPFFTDHFVMKLTASASEKDQFTLDNLYNFGANSIVIATVTSDTTFKVKSQNITEQSLTQFNVVGSGKISGKIITLEYVISDTDIGSSDNCTTVLTPQ